MYDGRAGADENPRTLKMSGIEISSSHWLNVLGGIVSAETILF